MIKKKLIFFQLLLKKFMVKNLSANSGMRLALLALAKRVLCGITPFYRSTLSSKELPVKKRYGLSGLSLYLCSFALMAGLCLPGAQAAATMKFKLSNQFPPTHHVSEGLRVFVAKVAEYSGNAMEVQIFDSGSLYRDAEVVKAIRSGSTETGLVPVNKWSGILPAVDIFEVPFVFRDLADLQVFLDGGASSILDEAFSNYGVKVLFWVDYGYVQFFNNKHPIKNPEDLKGLTMRAFSAGDQEILKALGAAPTIISSAELYLALQRGTIDGTTTGMPAAVARKVVEVQKYMTLSNYSTAEFIVQANLKWWNKLSDEQKDVITRASKDAEAHIREKVALAEAEAAQDIEKAGVEVYRLDEKERLAFIEATGGVREAYLKKSGDLGSKLLPLADELLK